MGFTITPDRVAPSGLGSVQVSDEVADNLREALAAQEGQPDRIWTVAFDTADEAQDVLRQMRRWALDNGVRFRVVRGTVTETAFSFRLEDETAARERIAAAKVARVAAKPRGKRK